MLPPLSPPRPTPTPIGAVQGKEVKDGALEEEHREKLKTTNNWLPE